MRTLDCCWIAKAMLEGVLDVALVAIMDFRELRSSDDTVALRFAFAEWSRPSDDHSHDPAKAPAPPTLFNGAQDDSSRQIEQDEAGYRRPLEPSVWMDDGHRPIEDAVILHYALQLRIQ
ncbi:hypothetical protein NUW54_g10842 [Trametes sanguinea]|uniref:Uncharacterized protein n=1 Tax=Trametes sanguinea TaxID=158606 RepID=A0ACC1NS64_9APHY|nr:hypothetical protein NUW54_g10842 [Trametes sanguinea]